MIKIRQLISPEAIVGLAKFQNQLKLLMQTLPPLFESMQLLLKGFESLVKKPEVRSFTSITKCKTLIHPIYNELFRPDFDINDIKTAMPSIKEHLLSRFPHNLKNDHREERYRQILECQMIGSYIAVCRSIYPEIEALLRDELLFANPAWRKKWESKNTPEAKSGFARQQFTDLTKNKLPGFEIVNENLTIAEVGISTLQFIQVLEEAFESFDQTKVTDPETKSFRHLHSHGWAKQATFIDGLNGLLTFDLALQLVSKKIFENSPEVMKRQNDQ